jgi:hypothetical protein
LVIPSFRSIQAVLTITDNAGNTASNSVTIQSGFGAAAGAGSFGPGALLILAALTGAALVRRHYAAAT